MIYFKLSLNTCHVMVFHQLCKLLVVEEGTHTRNFAGVCLAQFEALSVNVKTLLQLQKLFGTE